MTSSAPQAPASRARSVMGRLYRGLLDAVPDGAHRQVVYLREHGRPARLRPRSFTEKVNWRVAHDRRPELAWTCDKLQMKAHASAVPGLRVPETIWTGPDVAGLAGVALPEHWVLKPNHRSGPIEFGAGPPDLTALAVATEGWLAETQSRLLREWAYSFAERTLLVEEFLEGAADVDFKLFVFDGVVRLIAVTRDRHGSLRQCLYTPEWTRVDGAMGNAPAEPEPAPELLATMVRAAETLARGWDFMRVDLYVSDGEVWFGEVTPYPNSGLTPYLPRAFDDWLGDWWTLPGT